MIRLYEVTINGEDPTVVTAEALMEAWRENAPDGAAKALDLRLESSVTICDSPLVRVRRIR